MDSVGKTPLRTDLHLEPVFGDILQKVAQKRPIRQHLSTHFETQLADFQYQFFGISGYLTPVLATKAYVNPSTPRRYRGFLFQNAPKTRQVQMLTNVEMCCHSLKMIDL